MSNGQEPVTLHHSEEIGADGVERPDPRPRALRDRIWAEQDGAGGGGRTKTVWTEKPVRQKARVARRGEGPP
jgi:hypothetical protein